MVLLILVEITIPLGSHTLLLENLSSDAHVSGEGALLVDVGSLDGLLGGPESHADVSEVTACTVLLGTSGSGEEILLVQEDGGLLLEGFFVLLDH